MSIPRRIATLERQAGEKAKSHDATERDAEAMIRLIMQDAPDLGVDQQTVAVAILRNVRPTDRLADAEFWLEKIRQLQPEDAFL